LYSMLDEYSINGILPNGRFHGNGTPSLLKINSWGVSCIGYFKAGVPHREDGPAIITPKTDSYYCHGILVKVDKYPEERVLPQTV
jgi:hypothetical protein